MWSMCSLASQLRLVCPTRPIRRLVGRNVHSAGLGTAPPSVSLHQHPASAGAALYSRLPAKRRQLGGVKCVLFGEQTEFGPLPQLPTTGRTGLQRSRWRPAQIRSRPTRWTGQAINPVVWRGRLFTVLSAPIAINIVGNGAVNGAVNGQLLPIGTNIILTATSGAGYRLTNWLVQVDGVTGPFNKQAHAIISCSQLGGDGDVCGCADHRC